MERPILKRVKRVFSDKFYRRNLSETDKKWIDEPVVAFEPVRDFLFFDFGECLLYGGRAVDICGIAELRGVRLLASDFGDCFEDARLQCGELFHKKRKVFSFPVENELEGLGNIFGDQFSAWRSRQQNRFAKLLRVSGVSVGRGVYRVERFSGKRAGCSCKPLAYEVEETAFVDFADGERRCGMVERTGRMPEDVRHSVADASKKYVGCVGVELDSSTHDGEGAFTVFNVENVLKFIHDNANLSFGSLFKDCVEDDIERGGFIGDFRVERYGRCAGILIYGHNRPQVGEKAKRLGKPVVGPFKSRKGGDEPFAKIGKVSHSEKIGVEECEAFHVPCRFKHKGCLACAAFALDDDILPRLDVGREFLLEFWPRTEKLAFDCASVFKWIHALTSLSSRFVLSDCTIWYYTIRYYTKRCNGVYDTIFDRHAQGGIVPNSLRLNVSYRTYKEAA